MIVPRATHTATKLDDGRILIVGGFGTDTDADPGSTEFFDPTAASWWLAAIRTGDRQATVRG